MALTVFAEGPASLDPHKALYIPVGAASPLWLLFAGAASAGVAYWWMTRWEDRSNLEALLAPAHAAALPAPAADAVPPEPIAAVAEVSAVAGAMVEGALQAGAEATAAFIAAVAPWTRPNPSSSRLVKPSSRRPRRRPPSRAPRPVRQAIPRPTPDPWRRSPQRAIPDPLQTARGQRAWPSGPSTSWRPWPD